MRIGQSLFPIHFQYLSETSDSFLQILNYLGGNLIGFRQVVKVGQAPVLYPKNVEIGFVAGDDFVVGELAPTALGMRLAPRFSTQVAVFWSVALNEICQILKCEWRILERVVNVGAVIVNPNVLGLHILAGWTVVKEPNIGFYTVGIENTRR